MSNRSPSIAFPTREVDLKRGRGGLAGMNYLEVKDGLAYKVCYEDYCGGDMDQGKIPVQSWPMCTGNIYSEKVIHRILL